MSLTQAERLRMPAHLPDPKRPVQRATVLILVACIAAFAIDCAIDFPIAGGVIYLPIVFIGLLERQRRLIWVAAAIAVMLTVVGTIVPVIPDDMKTALTNRMLSILVIGASAFIANTQLNLVNQLRAESEALANVHATTSRFFHRVSREMRTPVHTVLTASEQLLLEGHREQRSSLLQIGDAGEQLLASIDNMLDLTDIERREFAEERVGIGELVERVVRRHVARAAERELKLDYDVAPNLWAMGDGWAIARALAALLDNAIKFTPPEGAITVTARRTRTAILLHVEDDGVGFPSSAKFDPQAVAADLPHHALDAAGLGLPLASILVTRLGGKLKIDPHRKLGAAVTLVLRAALPD
jgi:signal transduction histidine kinase